MLIIFPFRCYSSPFPVSPKGERLDFATSPGEGELFPASWRVNKKGGKNI